MARKKKIAFPQLGNYHVVFLDLVNLLGHEPVLPPPITRKTLEIGSTNSPEFVCVPFKYNLGNFIEALDAGADTILQAGGGCRFGYYAETQGQILKDMGYKFNLIKFSNTDNIFTFAKDFKRINPKLTYGQIANGFHKALWKSIYIERFEDFTRKNVGFEIEEGTFNKLERQFIRDIGNTKTLTAIIRVGRHYLNKVAKIKIDKPENPFRVGVVGEFYLVIEPATNYGIEKEIAKRGVEVHRFVTLTGMIKDGILGAPHVNKLIRMSKPYLDYHIGAHGLESVAIANKLQKQGFDGIIHIKPFGCIPEVNAVPALNRIGKEKKIPILYFTFDSQTSETGVKTRIEAFYEMINMRRKSEQKN